MESELSHLIGRLLAHRVLSRDDAAVRRALTDEAFRQEIDARLSACGLALLENPYAGYVAVGVHPETEEAVFGRSEAWLATNFGLPRDGVALLTVLWALIILPKRERQIKRFEQDGDAPQTDMFAEDKPITRGTDVSAGIAEVTLLADFARKLGGKSRINMNLGVLSRLGFIERRNKVIHEGPLLDLAIDYGVLAPRIMDGALAELFSSHSQPVHEGEASDSAEEEQQAKE